tara:strand:- start:422 stop:613 length:192 start_codon:yes stop_codon:yes gene_type:complete
MERFDITNLIYDGTEETSTQVLLRMASQGYADIEQGEEDLRVLASTNQIERFLDLSIDEFLEN